MWKMYVNYNNKKETGMTNFYLLPTIEYFRDRTFDREGDFSFNISFQWLFWSLTLTRYWGSIYNKNNFR